MSRTTMLASTSPLYAHHVDWKQLFATIVVLVCYAATFLSSTVNEAKFFLNIALIFLVTGCLQRLLFSQFHDVAVPNTFLINQFCAGIIPTYCIFSILSELMLFIVASSLFGGAVYVRTRQILLDNPNAPIFNIIIGSFASFNFQNLVATLRTSIWSVVFHAPMKEAVKWILARRYHRVTLLPYNVAVHRSISPDGIVAVAVSSAAGFAIIPALSHVTSITFSSRPSLLTIVFQVMNALLRLILLIGLEVGSTLFIGLTVAVRLRHFSSRPSVFISYFIAVLVHIDWLSMVWNFYPSSRYRLPLLPYYADISRFIGLIIISVLSACQAKVLHNRPSEHSD